LTTVQIGSFTVNGALIGGIIVPGVLVIAAILFPYFDRSPIDTVGVWLPKQRKWQNLVFVVIVVAILLLTSVGTFMRGPYWQFYFPWESWTEAPRRF
jgi:quinol-cytochrome oxidoreductase complex cytochrome b subunit